jgi:nucleotide-binding universal stress UspA family protein
MLKLLLPVDGSDSSVRAVEFAVNKKGWYKDPVELHLINVQPPMPFGSRVASVIGHAAIEQHHRDEGMAALKPAMQKLDAAGVPYVHHISVGDPAEVIAEFAKQKGCDQIVMGTKGLGATSLLLGSVTAKLIHLTVVPVLLVK